MENFCYWILNGFGITKNEMENISIFPKMVGTIDSSSIVWLLVLFVCLTLLYSTDYVMLGDGDCVVVYNKKRKETENEAENQIKIKNVGQTSRNAHSTHLDKNAQNTQKLKWTWETITIILNGKMNEHKKEREGQAHKWKLLVPSSSFFELLFCISLFNSICRHKTIIQLHQTHRIALHPFTFALQTSFAFVFLCFVSFRLELLFLLN